MALVFAAALCLSAVRGLARGQRAAWGRALIGTLLLLLVLVPMGPVQPDMAPGLSVFAAVNLVVLLAARRELEASVCTPRGRGTTSGCTTSRVRIESNQPVNSRVRMNGSDTGVVTGAFRALGSWIRSWRKATWVVSADLAWPS